MRQLNYSGPPFWCYDQRLPPREAWEVPFMALKWQRSQARHNLVWVLWWSFVLALLIGGAFVALGIFK